MAQRDRVVRVFVSAMFRGMFEEREVPEIECCRVWTIAEILTASHSSVPC